MDDRIRITIEVEQVEHDALAGIAEDRALTIGEIASQAVRARIDSERDFGDAMQAGLDDIESGRVIAHDEYLANAAERRRRWLAARVA